MEDSRPTFGRFEFMKFLDGHPPLPLTAERCLYGDRYCLWDVTDKAYDQIMLINNSPYWRALIKAHYARKETDAKV